ncbi:UvrD-helicase domain-containing protein [Granulosicoccus sp. 3-233]|uniref:UvrD-helicase domain-containing protein n=1 Tax=Granulosicoccus sp. 3-233 TaxID=3417969 RepID=UPI003D341007
MKLRCYEGLDPDRIPALDKFRAAIEENDFSRAQIAKIGPNLYRARLGKAARLLFAFYRAGEQTECLVLEHLPNHDYEKSRFLTRGVGIDPARAAAGQVLAENSVDGDDTTLDLAAIDAEATPLVYLNPRGEHFHVLDKVLSFDDEQQAIFDLPAPLVIVGSAGSGKTALTLEKLKLARGDVLYVSLSPYLVESARALYSANGYENDEQSVDFLSFNEFLESVRVPAGREVTQQDFDGWFARHRSGSGLGDGHALFEEFRGVITSPVGDKGWLSRAQYLELGIRQSIFTEAQRDTVYTLFERYLDFLEQSELFDPNIVCHRIRKEVTPRYDFVVVDEVQDFTNIQLYLLLSTLHQPGEFLLCGDANQIVHPNFFSWSSLKSLFFEQRELTGQHDTLHILRGNYRNSPLVTGIANRILKLKHARFGSVDRESNHLVESRGQTSGSLQLLEHSEKVCSELDSKTRRSTRFAVLVMHTSDKAAARRHFNTPLVFAIHEAKGLEYESIILYNFIAGEEKVFRDIARDVDPEQLEVDELAYARAKSKNDKSLEIYKFYINGLYVAITRAIRNVYLIEERLDHPAIRLLDLERFTGELDVEDSGSSIEEWQREARKLELQGKHEQAEAIHRDILEVKPVPWPVLDRESFADLRQSAFAENHRKKLLQVFETALLMEHQASLNELERLKFKPALQPLENAEKKLLRQHYANYEFSNPQAVIRDCERYGIDHRSPHNLTPLMIAARLAHAELIEALLDRGANTSLVANHGLNAWQILLNRATASPSAAFDNRAANCAPLLKPTSCSVQADNRLIKLGGHLMESFLLDLMIALFYRVLDDQAPYECAFTAADIASIVEGLPDSLLPKKRKRQSYISSVLSKNEVTRDGPYNRKLFMRIRRGHYIINPTLKLRIDGNWRPIHELLQLDDLAPRLLSPHDFPIHSEQQRRIREQNHQDELRKLEHWMGEFVDMVQAHKERMEQEQLERAQLEQ